MLHTLKCYMSNLFNKKYKKKKTAVLLLLLSAAMYRAVTMCQALCFMHVTNPLGTLIGQELTYPFCRYQGSDNLSNFPRKQMPLLFALKPVLGLLCHTDNLVQTYVCSSLLHIYRAATLAGNSYLTGEGKAQGRHKKVKPYQSCIQVKANS